MEIGIAVVGSTYKEAEFNKEQALIRRIRRHTQIEMRGLGLVGRKVRQRFKARSSDNCAFFLLKNRAQVIKYGFRYAVLAPDHKTFIKTLNLLKLNFGKMLVFDPADPPKTS